MWWLKPFQFVSLALMTQVVLLLNQVLLLPIQIRVWGTQVTAAWYATLAVAAVTTAADFGLRTAGHADLLRFTNDPSDTAAKTEFRHLWAWIRILVTLATTTLVVLDFVYIHFAQHAPWPLWRPALLIGIALEIVVIIRVMYLDTLGLYREAEGGYLLLAAARLIIAVAALLLFHAPPAALGWIWFFTGVFAIFQQNRHCRRRGILLLLERPPAGLSWRTLAVARHTLADPLSIWMRINGPVIVLSVFAVPAAITTYVALRAVFGAARTTILQLSRYASVEYLALRQARKPELAELQFSACVLAAAFFSSAVAGLVLVDNLRLASLLLGKVDLRLYQEIALTFALGGAFYCYQILQALMLRCGEVDRIANRQYLYMLAFVVFGVVAVLARSTLLWLVLVLATDLLISLSFLLNAGPSGARAGTSAGGRGFVAATGSLVLALALGLAARFDVFDFLREKTPGAVAGTLGLLAAWMLLVAVVDLGALYNLLARRLALGGLPAGLRAAKLQNE